MKEKEDLYPIARSHAKQAVNTYESRSKLKLINLGIPSTVPISPVPPTRRDGRAEAGGNERKSVVVCVSFNCHPLLDGHSSPRHVKTVRVATRRVSSDLTLARTSASLPSFKGRRVALRSPPLLPPLVSKPAGDISEKEMPNERAMESRLYNSWDHPAFVVDGSTQRASSLFLSLSFLFSVLPGLSLR